MSVVWHMFYESIGMQNLMVTSISNFDMMKGQCQVKLGQIFKFKIFLQTQANLVQFCLRIPKKSIFMYNNKKAKNSVWKKGHHQFNLVFGNFTAKNKDIALKFCICVVFGIFITYSFIIAWIFWFYWKLFFKKSILSSGGQSQKI